MNGHWMGKWTWWYMMLLYANGLSWFISFVLFYISKMRNLHCSLNGSSCSQDARITASLAPSFCKRWVAESISSKEMYQEWSAVSVKEIPRWARSKLSTCCFHLIPVSTKGVLWGTSLDVVVNAPRTCKTSTGIFGCPNSSSQIVVNSDRASGVAISAQNEKTRMRLHCSW